MSKSLVIVESPAKAKTIEKYLGKGFEVRASVGHIMDLPKNDIGVELKNRTFEPELVVSPGIQPCARVSVAVFHNSNWVLLSILATLYQPPNCWLFVGMMSTSAPTTSLLGSLVTTVTRSFALDKVLISKCTGPSVACPVFNVTGIAAAVSAP